MSLSSVPLVSSPINTINEIVTRDHLCADLSIIGERVTRRAYTHLRDFVADLALMFDNARIYNAPDSAVYKCAAILERHFRQLLDEAREHIGQHELLQQGLFESGETVTQV